MNQSDIMTLKKWINESSNIVFFGGAGVSTESGIPDFRSTDGLYHMEYDQPPETILSHTYYKNHRNEFFRFYKNKMIYKDAVPNSAHKVLARLEDEGKLKAVITQNIDGLHQVAGSKEVLELHGSVLRNFCEICRKNYTMEEIMVQKEAPVCSCGGTIKPDVVLYEEALDHNIINKAVKYIENAEVLVVGGTSLSVYPAAGLIDYFRGNKLILINKTPTPQDQRAGLVIYGSIGEILGMV